MNFYCITFQDKFKSLADYKYVWTTLIVDQYRIYIHVDVKHYDYSPLSQQTSHVYGK